MERRVQGKLHRLTAVAVAKLKTPGLHADGGGLYLQVGAGGARSWLFRFRLHGKRRDMGLGSATAVSLADARQKADEARRAVAAGIDPIRARDRADAEAADARKGTFAAVARQLLDGREDGWRNEKHRLQWASTLAAYAYPYIGEKLVSEIEVGDVENCLRPIWLSKPETARRVRQRIGAVIDFAIARGARKAGNPARPEILKHILPQHSSKPRHHAALPYAEIFAFVTALQEREAPAARALEFLILTAARSGEARGATWSEFDLATRVWTVPGVRAKSGNEHRVPLSQRAVDIVTAALDAAPKVKGKVDGAAYVFVGGSADGCLSENVFGELLERMGRGDITAHGFRSSFREWAAERTNYPRELAEKSLAHVVGDEAERAYQRGDLLEKRRAMMDAWATFCATPPTQGVLAFVKKVGGAK
jgi:integrase